MLDIQEIDILIEAIDAWVTASKTSSLLAGLFIGAMVSENDESTEKGVDVVKEFTAGEDEKRDQRAEQATLIKAKLIQMKRQLLAREAANYAREGKDT